MKRKVSAKRTRQLAGVELAAASAAAVAAAVALLLLLLLLQVTVVVLVLQQLQLEQPPDTRVDTLESSSYEMLSYFAVL